jgi:hypothetical protein
VKGACAPVTEQQAGGECQGAENRPYARAFLSHTFLRLRRSMGPDASALFSRFIKKSTDERPVVKKKGWLRPALHRACGAPDAG